MSVVRTTVAVVGVAIAVSRHPLVRAGLRHAPKLMTPKMRQMATDAVLDTAYSAGVAARRIIPRKMP